MMDRDDGVPAAAVRQADEAGRLVAAGHLSEALDVPLVTCDRHLAATPGHSARVELFGAAAETEDR